MVQKINPIYANTDRSFIGKTLTELTLDFNVDVSASTAPGGVIDTVIKAISSNATIVMMSAITGLGQLMTVFVEGDFPTDTYDGTNSETFATYMQSVIVALGVTDTLDLSGATVVAGTVYAAD